MRWHSRHALLVALVAPVLLSGCETASYYAQAIGGQVELLAAARPVDAVLADASTPTDLRNRLARSQAMRAFATRELKLPDNRSYRMYAAIDRPAAVWNVVAAPEFSLVPVKSCFPIAGCVSYRGFFAQAGAEAHAAARRAEGLDVVVRPVPAYSTLGWFDDPLLSTFIRRSEIELARLMFHELAHQVVYVAGDSTFNESFAAVVEAEGVRRWVEAEGRAGELSAVREADARRRAFLDLIGETRARLDALYRLPLAQPEMRERKRAEFERLQSRYAALRSSWNGALGYDRLMQAPNNALIASIATYTQCAPAFRRLFDAEQGDFEKFYRRVKALPDTRAFCAGTPAATAKH